MAWEERLSLRDVSAVLPVHAPSSSPHVGRATQSQLQMNRNVQYHITNNRGTSFYEVTVYFVLAVTNFDQTPCSMIQ